MAFGIGDDLFTTTKMASFFGRDGYPRIDKATGVLTQFPPTSTFDGSQPPDLAFGADGNVYVTTLTHEIRRFNVTTGQLIDVFVPAGSGGLAAPRGIVLGPDANLYVVSNATDSILRYNGTTGAFIDAFIMSGSGSIDSPMDLLFDPNGNLLVSTTGGQVLRYNSTTGAFIDTLITTTNVGLNSGGFMALAIPEPGAAVWIIIVAAAIRRYSRD